MIGPILMFAGLVCGSIHWRYQHRGGCILLAAALIAYLFGAP